MKALVLAGGFGIRLKEIIHGWPKVMTDKKIPPDCYCREYFFFEGWREEFNRFQKGGRPGEIYLQAFKFIPKGLAGPFLDIGCGRGELVIYLARKGKKADGVDYSPAAIKICREALKSQKESVRALASFKLADSTKLPFKKNSFQCLFLLDIVEHLTPRQFKLTLKEAKRVLEKEGALIVHTNNKYFEKITKFLIGFFYHGTKTTLPSEPYEELHINYLTGSQLMDRLRKMGFEAKIKYLKPRRKSDLKKFVPYKKGWKRSIFYNFAWVFLNSPLVKFLSPTFWVVARKVD